MIDGFEHVEYLCYGSTALINIVIVSVRGPSESDVTCVIDCIYVIVY